MSRSWSPVINERRVNHSNELIILEGCIDSVRPRQVMYNSKDVVSSMRASACDMPMVSVKLAIPTTSEAHGDETKLNISARRNLDFGLTVRRHSELGIFE